MRLDDLSGTLLCPSLVLRRVVRIRLFHILFLIPKLNGDKFIDCLNLEKKLYDEVLKEWRRNYGSRRNPDYRPLCTLIRRFIRGKLRTNYDLHYVNPALTAEGVSDVAFYVTKYMMKPSDRAMRLQQALHLNLDEIEYEQVWSKVRPRSFCSIGLGVNGELTPFGVEPDYDIVKYIRGCVDTSKGSEESAKFYNPQTGTSFPLSRYYKSKFYCYDVSDEAVFVGRQKRLEGNVVVDETSFTQKVLSIDRHKNRVEIIDTHDHSCEFDEIYE